MQDLTVVLTSAADAVVVGKCKMEAATIPGSGPAAFKPPLPCITNHPTLVMMLNSKGLEV